MEAEGLIASLDPPSTHVNSAKLERHLSCCDAMVVVLTERETGTSPHIMYEISLGIRSGKPLLVFVEDTLPRKTLPPGILQCRFSLRSYPRNVREHRQALTMLRAYIGEPTPRHLSPLSPRTCLLLGSSVLAPELSDTLQDFIERNRRYAVLPSRRLLTGIDEHPTGYSALREVSLAIAFTGAASDRREDVLLGELRGTNIPLIQVTAEPLSAASARVPVEYQPRVMDPDLGAPALIELVANELEIFEEDFLELSDGSSADRYTQFLIELGGRGRYGALTRERGVEVIMGDRYHVQGQPGAVGPNSHVHDVTFVQLWNQQGDKLDLPSLAEELAQLRVTLREQATTPEDDQVVADIGQAELAARQGDGAGAFRHLKAAGKWALDTATAIGAAVAAEAVKVAMGN
ncbi:hypothetical protein O3597_25760 [Verrucosispora sp. WMMA2044]|uniref:hypothetical protein n=1 Tax=Verrucosispora sp. WMMA2044 TaxID=3016419 RepID=UPI00248CE55D|nr:hypothetical protein [Verrucosispora sp. WMMA2044]WBB48448.1 hypothetical protein O3597_25760 [Verrucosispora sp. WMMA2044]